MNELDDEIERFEKEKKSLKIKYIIITIVVAIFVAVIASEATLYYYNSNTLKKVEASSDAKQNIM